jgi:hypothetical protein
MKAKISPYTVNVFHFCKREPRQIHVHSSFVIIIQQLKTTACQPVIQL